MALPQQERVSIRDTAQRQRGCGVHVTPGLLSSLYLLLENLPPTVPICVCGKVQSDAGVMRVSASVLKRI